MNFTSVNRERLRIRMATKLKGTHFFAMDMKWKKFESMKCWSVERSMASIKNCLNCLPPLLLMAAEDIIRSETGEILEMYIHNLHDIIMMAAIMLIMLNMRDLRYLANT